MGFGLFPGDYIGLDYQNASEERRVPNRAHINRAANNLKNVI